MKIRLGAALAVAVVAAAVLVSVAASSPRMLYGCAYVTNLGNSSDVNVLTWDKHAPGAHGWIMFVGSGLNETKKFTLDSNGWHTERFHVTSFDTEKITVGLYKPKLSYAFKFTLNAASDVTSKGCKPH